MSHRLRQASRWSTAALLAVTLGVRIEVLLSVGWHNLGTKELRDVVVSNSGRAWSASEPLRRARIFIDRALAVYPMARTYRNAAIVSILLGQAGVAVEESRIAVELNSTDDMNYIALGRAYDAGGRLGSIFGTYFEKGYQPQHMPNTLVAGLLVVEGDGYYQEGKLALASERYYRAIGDDPSYAPAYLGLSRINASQGKDLEALYLYREALIIGGCCLKVDVYEGYYQLLAQVVENNAQTGLLGRNGPGETDYILGEAYWKGGQTDLAVAALNRALSNAQTLTRGQYVRVHFLLGLADEQGGRFESAIDHYERSVDLDVRRVDVQLHLLRLYEKLGLMEDAVRVTRHVAALQPEGDVDDVRPGVHLLGYDVDETEMEVGPVFSMTLYWQVPSGIAPSGTDSLQIGDRLLVVVTVHNLAANGAFEWPDPRDKVLGFADYDLRARVATIVAVSGPVAETYVLDLPPATIVAPSGVQSPAIGLLRGIPYLLGAEHLGHAGSEMRLQCRWVAPSGQSAEASVGSERAVGRWTGTGGIVQLPEDSPYRAGSVRLLNLDPQFDLLFDNVFLVELPQLPTLTGRVK